MDLGAKPTAVSKNGVSILMYCAANASKGSDAAYNFLQILQKEPNLSQEDKEGKTVIHALVEGRNDKLFELALPYFLPEFKTKKLDINKPIKSGSTPISMCVDSVNPEMLFHILENGGDPNQKSQNKFSEISYPLHMMVATDKPDGTMVKLAIEKGADVWIRDDNGNNVWAFFAMRQTFSQEIFEILEMAGAITDETYSKNELNLYSAIFRSQPTPEEMGYEKDEDGQYRPKKNFKIDMKKINEKIKNDLISNTLFLINKNISVDPQIEFNPKIKDKSEIKGTSAISGAMLNMEPEIVKLLIEKSKNLNMVDKDGLSPLLCALDTNIKENEGMVLMLLANSGKNIEKDLKNVTQKRDKKKNYYLNLLLKNGANPNHKVYEEIPTAFMKAIELNDIDAIGLFLKYGCSPLERSEDGISPLIGSIIYGKTDLFLAMMEYINKNSPEKIKETADTLLRAVYSSPEKHEVRAFFREALKISFKEYPEMINYQDEEGNTPLIVAAATLQEDVVDILLSIGADPNKLNKSHECALLHAIVNGKGDIVKSLRRFGVNMEETDSDGDNMKKVAALQKGYVYKAFSDILEETGKEEFNKFVKPDEQFSKLAEKESVDKIVQKWTNNEYEMLKDEEVGDLNDTNEKPVSKKTKSVLM